MLKFSKFSVTINNDNRNYLINTLSQAVIELDTKHYEIVKRSIESNDLSFFTNDEIVLLSSNQFIVDESFSELSFLKLKYNENIYSSSELETLILEPTLSCNFACKYCFEKSHRMDICERSDYFEALANHVRNSFSVGRRIHFNLFGGEPLLKWNEFKKFFTEICKYENYYSSITTNGYLFTNESIDELIELGKCKYIQITLDGPKSIHDSIRYEKQAEGSYDKLVNVIKQLSKIKNSNAELTIIVRINLLNISIDDFSKILDSFSEEEINNLELLIRPVFNTDSFHDNNLKCINELSKYYEIALKRGAKISKNTSLYQHCEGDGYYQNIHILPDLSIRKCVIDLGYNPTIFGKMDINGEFELDYKNIVEWYKNSPFDDEKCKNCICLPLCCGGCPLYYRKKEKRQCLPKNMLLESLIY